MPETPTPKPVRLLDPPTEVAAGEPDYAELDVTTNFSFLRGASHPDELVFTAAMLGYRALAVTDVNSLAGVVRAHAAAKQVKGFHLIVGARLQLTDAPNLLVWATDRAAYGRLCKLLTLGKRRAEKGECSLALEDFLDHSDGMVAALAPAPFSLAQAGPAAQRAVASAAEGRMRLVTEDSGLRIARYTREAAPAAWVGFERSRNPSIQNDSLRPVLSLL